MSQARRDLSILNDKVVELDTARTCLENELINTAQEHGQVTQERQTIDAERQAIAARNVDLESEIVEHLQGRKIQFVFPPFLANFLSSLPNF